MITVFKADLNFGSAISGDLHPVIGEALKILDSGTAPGVDYDFLAKNLSFRGDALRVLEGWRSPERQKILYDQGMIDTKTKPTNAGPYESYHQYGLAVDIVFSALGYGTHSDWIASGIPAFMNSRGIKWGGNWKDFPDLVHFEYPVPVPIDNVFARSGWWLVGPDTAPIMSRSTKKQDWGAFVGWSIAVAGAYHLFSNEFSRGVSRA